MASSLIYQSIKYRPAEDFHPEHKLWQAVWDGDALHEAFMPTNRSVPSDWGMITLPRDAFPDISIPYKTSFQETTDSRAQELAQHVDRKDLPIIVSWSGGIDSTLILAALVKNWPKYLLDRVRIKMNRASYFENPWFFDKIIAPLGFQIQHQLHKWNNCFVFTGNCADSLWVQADIIELETLWPGSSQWSMIERKDDLLRWYQKKSSQDDALGVYDMIIESSQQAKVELHTFEDFYWWLNFNFVYTGQLYKYLGIYATDRDRIDLDAWHDQHIGWYHNDAYQSWSVWNRSNGTKIDRSVRSYKWPAKQYIYDLDGNHWYRDYKTKMQSPLIAGKQGGWLKALYSDGTVLI